MLFALDPVGQDLAQHAHAAGARRGLRDGVHDVDVLAQHFPAQLDEWLDAHAAACLRVPRVARVPRTYAQSAFGQSSSQVTAPPVSRSMSIASVSAHVRYPYDIFRRCPADVPTRAAKAARSLSDNVLR